MANTWDVRDVHALMNEIAKEALGQNAISVVDTTTFATVGETLLRSSAEQTLGVISNVLAKTIFSVRPYKGKLEVLKVAQERWGSQVRKLVPLYSDAEASTDWNTTENPNTLVDGGSIDPWKINKPKMLQLNFYGSKVLQKSITRFRDQLSTAFQNETEFMAFIDAFMIEFMNEIEVINESEARATLINAMAGVSSMGLTEVDLVAEYNTEYGQHYTREQLLSTYLESFMKFVASTIKTYSAAMTDYSKMYHANITGYAPIMRHTPKANQKMVMYEPIFIKSQATVYSSLFNPTYLEIGEYEGVNFWQSKENPTEIKCKPNILDVATGASKDAETDVEIPYVLGMLFDQEALGILPQFEYSSTTPFNSAGGYYNIFYHWRFNSFVDYTENMVLFVLGAGGE